MLCLPREGALLRKLNIALYSHQLGNSDDTPSIVTHLLSAVIHENNVNVPNDLLSHDKRKHLIGEFIKRLSELSIC